MANALNTLPVDVLGHIFGKVDTMEHMTKLIEKMSPSEMNQLKYYIDKRLENRRNKSFSELKQKWIEMRDDNKKNGTNRKMYVEFNRGGICEDYKDYTFVVDRFRGKYMYGDEVSHKMLRNYPIGFNVAEYFGRYWIE
jgi:hypothetical protein